MQSDAKGPAALVDVIDGSAAGLSQRLTRGLRYGGGGTLRHRGKDERVKTRQLWSVASIAFANVQMRSRRTMKSV